MPPLAKATRYELTLFKPRSEDPTETQPLAQLEDAAQTFVVTTDPADDHPYLDRPSWRGGEIKVPQRTVEVGSATVRILDARVTSNLDRWLTRFLGDARGMNRLKGLKARLREWDSDSSSWVTLYTLRVNSVRMAGSKLWVDLALKDLVKDLETDVFVGPGHGSLSYVSRGALLPAGLITPWAGMPARVAPLRGVMVGTNRIRIDTTRVSGGRDIIITPLRAMLFDPGLTAQPVLMSYLPEYIRTARVHVKIIQSTANPLRVGEEGELWLAKTIPWASGGFIPTVVAVGFALDDKLRWRARDVGVQELIPEDPNYIAAPAADDVVEFHIKGYGPASPGDPLLIGPVHPAAFVEDMLAGKFGPLIEKPWDGTVGEPMLTFPSDAAAFATLKADPSFGELYMVATEPAELREVVEKNINLPHGLGYRIDADGQYVPIDWRLTAAHVAGVLTITDEDLAAGDAEAFEWEDTQEGAVTRVAVKYYTDILQPSIDLEAEEGAVDVPSVRFETQQHVSHFILSRFGQLRDSVIEVDALGIRDIALGQQDGASQRVKTQVARVPEGFRSAFGNGPGTFSLRLRRTANVVSCVEGSLRKIALSVMPDPITRRRGGPRLARCLQRIAEGPYIRLRFLDLGSDTVSAPPALGVVVKNATDPEHAVDVPVTLNASVEPAVVEYALTATSVVVRPAEDDAAWRYAGRLVATGTLVARTVPSGMRVWLRGRTETADIEDAKVPSAWVFPAASYVDVDTLPAPTGLAVVAVGQALVATWTPGRADLPVMPVIALNPGPAVNALDAPLPLGSERYVFDQLAAGTYIAGIKHVDGVGGESAAATAVVATAAPALATEPTRVQIRQGRGATGAQAGSPTNSIGYGLWVGFQPADAYASHRLEVSTDSLFSTLEVEVVLDPGVTLHPAIVQRDAADAVRYVRVRAERDGYTPSIWSDIVSAWPTELLPTPGIDQFPGGNADIREGAGGKIELRIGHGGDTDTERAYFAIVKNPALPTDYPDVDETSDFVARVDMPYDGPVDDGGGGDLAGVPGDLFLGRVRFWNPVSGFGQETLLKLTFDGLQDGLWARVTDVRYRTVQDLGMTRFMVDLKFEVGPAVKSLHLKHDVHNYGGGFGYYEYYLNVPASGDLEFIHTLKYNYPSKVDPTIDRSFHPGDEFATGGGDAWGAWVKPYDSPAADPPVGTAGEKALILPNTPLPKEDRRTHEIWDGPTQYLGSGLVAGTALNITTDADGRPVLNVTAGGGGDLNDLGDVAISLPANRHALLYNSGSALWENRAITAADIGAGTFGAGNFAFPADLAVSGTLTLGGDALFAGTRYVRASTADGADTARLILAGGGSAAMSRGAYIALSGNEEAGSPGHAYLAAGSLGNVYIYSQNELTASFGNDTVTHYGITVTGGKAGTDARYQWNRPSTGANLGWIGVPSWLDTHLHLYAPNLTATGSDLAARYGAEAWNFYTAGSPRLTIDNVGRTTSAGAASEHLFTLDGANTAYLVADKGATANYAGVWFKRAGSGEWLIRTETGTNPNLAFYSYGKLGNALILSHLTGDATFGGHLTVNAGNIYNSTGIYVASATNNRTKIQVWSTSLYGIGMTNGVSYGGIGSGASDFAMTFQMNNSNSRGFWWGDDIHTGAQGAMALTTDGKLTVAHSIRIGYGEADVVTPGGTYPLDVSGSIRVTSAYYSNAATSDWVLAWTSTTGTYGIKKLTDQGGIRLGADSSIFIHAGDSTDSHAAAAGLVAAYTGEVLWLASDYHVTIATNLQSGWPSRHQFVFDAGVLNAPVNLTVAGDAVAVLARNESISGVWGHQVYDYGSKTTATNIDALNGNIQRITLGASITLSPTNFTAGRTVRLYIEYGGAFTPTLSGVDWGDFGVPAWSSSGPRADVVTLEKVGSIIFAYPNGTGFTNPT